MLMSLYLPGLGQIYNGQWAKGLLFTSSVLLLMLSVLEFPWINSLPALLFVLACCVIIYLVAVLDALVIAGKRKNYLPRFYNHWVIYIGFILLANSLPYYYALSGNRRLQGYSIPSMGNAPSMVLGDWMIADNRAYQHAQPQYGDLIIFTGPDQFIWTFRVVGLPGDEVEVKDGRLQINQKPCGYTFKQRAGVQEIDGFTYPVSEFTETLPNGVTHGVYYADTPYDSTLRNQPLRIIPPNEYYVMGDNRDYSLDSRSIGLISESRIIGKMLFCYFSPDVSRIGLKL